MSGLVSWTEEALACVQADVAFSCLPQSWISVGLVDGQQVELGLSYADGPNQGVFRIVMWRQPGPSGHEADYRVKIAVTKEPSTTPHAFDVSPSVPLHDTAEEHNCQISPTECSPLAVNARLITDGLLTLQVDRPDALAQVTHESQGIIMSARVEPGEDVMEVDIKNWSNDTASYVVTVSDCRQDWFEQIPAQSKTLNAGEEAQLTFRLRPLFSLPDSSHTCLARLWSPAGRRYDATIVVFDWLRNQEPE